MESPNNTVRVDVISARELLSKETHERLRIPVYQRGYAWTAEQVVALCQDILSAFAEQRREYHVGTVILHENGDWLDIVDGQQRLTTICLLLGDAGHRILTVESGTPDNCSIGKIEDAQAEKLLAEVQTTIGEQGLIAVRQCLPQCTFVCIVVKDVAEAFQLFDTQNGRGKALTPANLLKAFHFHEMTHGTASRMQVSKERQYELEAAWENIGKGGDVAGSQEQRLRGLDGPLLPHLLGEHLFRLRRWCRGDDAFYTYFNNKQIGEFKGVTLSEGKDIPPCHATAFLRQFFRVQHGVLGLTLEGIPSRIGGGRRNPRELDPFQSISQSIVNGEDFFLYIQTYAIAYRMLFGDCVVSGLDEFKTFYKKYCLDDPNAWHIGNCYARHVFESLCLLIFDRFGSAGLLAHYRLLYRFAYWERCQNMRLWYQTAGETFAPKAIRAMMAHETLAELNSAFAGLRSELETKCKSSKEADQHLFLAGRAIVYGNE